jgi:4-amino-4-deoxy-L-arabinose transferase-like glycosyltransferase
VCACAAALFPNWVWYGSDLLTDIPGALATACTAWALVEARRRNSLGWFALAGLTCGAGVLFRATGMALLPGMILWIFLVMPGWRRHIPASALVCGVLACVIAPWVVRNTSVQGEFVPLSTQGGIEIYIANNPRATGILADDFKRYAEESSKLYPRDDFSTEAQRSSRYQADAVTFIREHPGRFFRLCAVRLGQLWKVYSPRVPLWSSLMTIGSFGVLLPFAAIQIARRGWRRGPTMLHLIMIASFSAVHAVYTSVIRYRIPFEPLVIALAAAGLIWLIDRRKSRAADGG